MRKWIIAVLAVISALSVAVALSAHASPTRTDAPQSTSTRGKEQGYLPLCGLQFEHLVLVRPDRFIPLKICI